MCGTSSVISRWTKLDYRHMNHWVKSMTAKGRSPKTIHHVHGLISAAMNTAEMLQYIPGPLVVAAGVSLAPLSRSEDQLAGFGGFVIVYQSSVYDVG